MKYGVPQNIKTDNEANFSAPPIKILFKAFGITHVKSEKHCPWQNGRIERFFKTFKEKLCFWEINNLEELDLSVKHFRYWYNNICPHQHLDGKTPNQVWEGIDPFVKIPTSVKPYSAWDGLLDGFQIEYG